MGTPVPNAASLLRPKFGGLFLAAEGTNPIADLPDFTPTSGGPAAWTNPGHLSRTTLPSRSSDGGDTMSLDTWQVINVYSEPGEETLSWEYTLLQWDAETINSLSALHGQSVSFLELLHSGTKRGAKWVPSAKASWSQEPMADNVDDWANMKFRLSMQAPPISLNLASLVDPSSGIAGWPTVTNPQMLIFDDLAFQPSGG